MSNLVIFVLNGPNLNLLGEREPEIYGTTTMADMRAKCGTRAATLGLDIDFRQTNVEGELIEHLHEARCKGPKIESHISKIHTRESIYHTSLVSRTATGLVVGFGAYGYEMALDAMHHLLVPA